MEALDPATEGLDHLSRFFSAREVFRSTFGFSFKIRTNHEKNQY
jgi:hypothetical protein